MLARASAETGLDDFGDEEFRDGLARLVECTNLNMVLSPLGRTVFQEEVHRHLVNRLRFAADLKKYPQILDERLDDPVIILGMPRTGTTKLHRMLAADPAVHSLKVWQTLNPAPLPGHNADHGEDARVEIARQALTDLARLSPGMMQSHPQKAEYPEEEIYLHMFTFRSEATCMGHPAPGYYDWLAPQSLRGSYRYMKQLLQYVQWQQGGRKGRRWMLKSPTHLGNMDLLVEMFPRAQYVFAHRDLNEVMPSFCRLMEMAWRLKTDDVDMHALGRFMIDLWSRKMDRHLRQMEDFGTRIDIYDVDYRSIKADPISVARDIHRHLDLAFTAESEQAMRDWEEREDAYGKFGNYSYSLEQYGLSREAIDHAFRAYHDRYLRSGSDVDKTSGDTNP